MVVLTNGNNQIRGSFAGSGAGLSNVTVAAGNVVGTLGAGQVPDLDANKLTTGTLAPGRIPDLDAGKLTSGTVADARLSGNVARLDGTNVFAGTNRFGEVGVGGLGFKSGRSGGAEARIAGYPGGGTNDTLRIGYNLEQRPSEHQLYEWFENSRTIGSLSALRWSVQFATPSLPGPSLVHEPFAAVFDRASGSTFETDVRGDLIVLANSSGANPWAKFQASGISLFAPTTISGAATAITFIGSGAGLTNVSATGIVGTLAAGRIPSLDAGKLVSGTVADARLSGNVARLDGTNVFAGTNRFAGVVVMTNGNNQLGGSFVGDGAGLTRVPGTVIWQVVSDLSAVMEAGKGYLCTNAVTTTLTLPTTPKLGDTVRVSGSGNGGWKLGQNAGQTIDLGAIAGLGSTTPGASGFVVGAKRSAIELQYVGGGIFMPLSYLGSLTPR